MWIGFHSVMDLVVTSGQMRVILVISAEGAEVIFHAFGATDVGMLILLVFLIWSKYLMLMLAVLLAYKAVIQEGGLVFQNCP